MWVSGMNLSSLVPRPHLPIKGAWYLLFVHPCNFPQMVYTYTYNRFIIMYMRKNKLYGDQDGTTPGCSCSCPLTASPACICGCVVNGYSSHMSILLLLCHYAVHTVSNRSHLVHPPATTCRCPDISSVLYYKVFVWLPRIYV